MVSHLKKQLNFEKNEVIEIKHNPNYQIRVVENCLCLKECKK